MATVFTVEDYISDLKEIADRSNTLHVFNRIVARMPKLSPSKLNLLKDKAVSSNNEILVAAWYDCLHKCLVEYVVGTDRQVFVRTVQ